MNRKLYLGIMSFFAVVFVITFSFLPYYNPIYFYLQHISLFLFVAMLLYFLLQLGFNRLVKRIKKQSLLRGYTITVLVVVLFVFSSLQLKFIETYQTSEFQFCEYYDDYNNAIYYTQLPNNCPELEITEKTDISLSFEVYEETEGIAKSDYMGLNISDEYELKAKSRTSIKLIYDSNGNIIESTMQKSTNIFIYYPMKPGVIDKEYPTYEVYNSIITHIENEVVLDNGEPVAFISKQSTGKILDTFKDFDNLETVEHYLDNQYDFEYVMFKSEKTISDINDITVEHLYQIEISKLIFDNADFIGDPVKDNVIQLLDFVCTEDTCAVKRQDYNYDRSQYVLLEQSDLIEFDDEHTMTISKDKIEIKFPVYRYTESEKHYGYTTYSEFKDYGLVFDNYSKSYDSILNPATERETFRYAGKDYIEHGRYYGVVYKTDYGLKVLTKVAEMEKNGGVTYPFVQQVSSEYFESPYHRVIHNIYDYGNRAHYNPIDRDEIIFQRNPLIFTLIEYK